jgi:hypothetical protein
MVLPSVREEDGRSGSTLFNLIVLAATIPAAFAAWIAIGELIGDVAQSDGDGGVVLDVSLFVVSTLYVSLILLFLFIPGFALFLLSLRLVDRRPRLSTRGRRLVALALSPLIGAGFLVIPAIPEDRDGVWSGWWFILGTSVIAALLVRWPQRSRTT